MKWMALIVVLTPALSLAAFDKPLLSKLAIEGERDAGKCNEALTKIRALDKNFDFGRTFPSKRASLEALKLLEKLPGTPKATRQLMEKLASAKPKDIDYKWLSHTIDRTLVCDPMTQKLILTKLVRSSRAFKFSAAEKRLLGKVAVRNMKQEAEHPTHLGLLAPYLMIVDALVEQGAIRLTVQSALKRDTLKSQIDAGLDQLKEREDLIRRKVNDRVFQTQNFVLEVRQNEPVRVSFLQFLAQL